MIVYEYLEDGAGVLSFWALQKRERTRLEAKLEMLEKVDYATAQQLVRGVKGYGGIFKLQLEVQSVQLRPILCYGPVSVSEELTFLMPAYERNWEWEPRDAPDVALQRKAILENDPRRRVEYESESTTTH